MYLQRQGSRKLLIELILLFAFAAAIGVAVVKVIEWKTGNYPVSCTDRTSLESASSTSGGDNCRERRYGPSVCIRSFFYPLCRSGHFRGSDDRQTPPGRASPAP